VFVSVDVGAVCVRGERPVGVGRARVHYTCRGIRATIVLVTEHAHTRTMGPPPGLPPRVDVIPNGNPEIGTVGADVPTGTGDDHVLYPANNPPVDPMPWAGWPAEWAMPAWNGQLDMAGLIDVAFAAIDRNASAFASMPPGAIKGGRPLDQQPTWTRNPLPMLYASWHEFASQLWWAFQTTGEAIVLALDRYENGYPRTFFVTPPWLINVSIVEGLRYYTVGGEDVTNDVCHIRYVSTNTDAHGHGPLEAATGRIRTILALQRYATNLAAGGGIPWGVLKSKFKLTAAQANSLRAQWVAAAQDRLGAPAVLDNETDLMISQIQPKDMQLVELQQAAEARIAVLLGVPPYLLALPVQTGSTTYANATLIYQEHYGWLRTKIVQIAGALSGWSLPWGTDIEFDAERYIQPPAKERAETYQILFNLLDPSTGRRVMTVDEIRHAERIDLLEVPS
jgi:HK97 family phage portal protein